MLGFRLGVGFGLGGASRGFVSRLGLGVGLGLGLGLVLGFRVRVRLSLPWGSQ